MSIAATLYKISDVVAKIFHVLRVEHVVVAVLKILMAAEIIWRFTK